ncbi:MAG: glycosyltransferase [Planctomycetes bacterium]|nr:glycosyltransferase [Planctomycetota bacterium]
MNNWTEGVSLLVPVKNAEKQLEDFFKSLKRSEVLEVILCDCGSTDQTVAIGRNNGANIIRGDSSPRDIINKAVCHARGTALWFLTPSARPPVYAGSYIIGALEEPKVCAGWWPVRCIANNWTRRWKSFRLNMAASFFGKVLPEHGVYISRMLFENIGGYPASEDAEAEMIRQAKAKGKILVMPDPIKIIEA